MATSEPASCPKIENSLLISLLAGNSRVETGSTLPARQLGHADIEFLVFKNGRVFGKLLVSKGAIVWRRKWKSKRGKKLGWTRFDKAMHERGRSV
jgi:hypothetical protein